MWTICLAVPSCMLFLCASAFAASLRSPWDALTIPATSRPYTRPAIAPLPRDIVAYDYYSDARKSVPDSTRLHAYRQAATPFSRTMSAADRAAEF
jgi:hypothetical protein